MAVILNMNALRKPQKDVEETSIDAAKRRQKTGAYFGDRGFQNMQKASDRFVLEHYNKK